jgi:hypothetical protein
MLPLDETLRLQSIGGVTHRGGGEPELPGELADSPKLDVTVELIDEKLGPYRAQIMFSRFLA